MILAEKITMLRKKKGWSQEELAMRLSVSRQSVSKWESTASLPELDKIIKLSEVFGVSTDYLIKDSLEEPNVEIFAENEEGVYIPEEAGKSRSVSVEEAGIYMNLVEEAAWKIGAGVAACILSPVILLLLLGMSEGGVLGITEDMAAGIGIAILLIIVAGAVAVLIFACMKVDKFEYLEKEVLDLQYGVAGIVEVKKERFEGTFKSCIATGVTLCIVSVVPLFLAGAFGASGMICLYCVAVLLMLAAVAVFLFIWVGMIWSSYEKLLEIGDYTTEKKLKEKRNDELSKVYWSVTTAIYLGYSFLSGDWHISWVIWPLAGVLYAAVTAAADMIRRK